MSHRVMTLLCWLLTLGIAVPRARAQGPVPRSLVPKQDIPRSLRPPHGMCRVWLDNVPARQQPAPTDCATAIRNRPPNGRVIFSDDTLPPSRPKSGDKSGDKGEDKKRPKKPPEGSRSG